MRRDDQGSRQLVGRLDQYVDHMRSGGLVELSGRLVGEDQDRASGEDAGHRHPLRLPAGQLLWPFRPQPADVEPIQRLRGARLRFCIDHPREHQREGDVLDDVKSRQQARTLEHHADQAGASGRVTLECRPGDPAGGRSLQPSHQVQQRGLPRAGRADQRDAVPRVDRDRDAVHGHHGRQAAPVRPSHVLAGHER